MRSLLKAAQEDAYIVSALQRHFTTELEEFRTHVKNESSPLDLEFLITQTSFNFISSFLLGKRYSVEIVLKYKQSFYVWIWFFILFFFGGGGVQMMVWITWFITFTLNCFCSYFTIIRYNTHTPSPLPLGPTASMSFWHPLLFPRSLCLQAVPKVA